MFLSTTIQIKALDGFNVVGKTLSIFFKKYLCLNNFINVSSIPWRWYYYNIKMYWKNIRGLGRILNFYSK